uniref:Uncharacterized protein n=1 Tax=Globisporangium ultimum (strain ATCC 200006 / CBS 805.95 / DAOM BR144) TaxID=431595 RepID=K3WWB2_GLOUD
MTAAADPPPPVSLDAIAPDSLRIVASFLSARELLQLSHATSFMLAFFEQDEFWGACEPKRHFVASTSCKKDANESSEKASLECPPEKRPNSAKQDFWRHRALHFGGNRKSDDPGTVRKPHHGYPFKNAVFQRATAFSFEFWFVVHSAEKHSERRRGGVLFGAQSKPFTVDAPSFFHQQFVLIDPNLKLYCSVRKSQDKRLLTTLRADQWYHLVVVSSHEYETVYLDGYEMLTVRAPLPSFFWTQYQHCQVGTGLVRHKWMGPASHVGWYNLNGVVDTFRIYDQALAKETVRELAHSGGLIPSLKPVYSMRKELFALNTLAEQRFVRCTRPGEGHFEQL